MFSPVGIIPIRGGGGADWLSSMLYFGGQRLGVSVVSGKAHNDKANKSSHTNHAVKKRGTGTRKKKNQKQKRRHQKENEFDITL